jgi:hypothetical protein
VPSPCYANAVETKVLVLLPNLLLLSMPSLSSGSARLRAMLPCCLRRPSVRVWSPASSSAAAAAGGAPNVVRFGGAVLASCCLVGEQDAGCHALGAQASSGASSFLVGGGRERERQGELWAACACVLFFLS